MILLRHGQSAFNLVFDRTGADPGIPDPGLTPAGRRQAAAAAGRMRGLGLRRAIASPYRRALETAAFVAEALSLPITVEPLVGERAFFVCDVGSCRSELARLWPGLDFAALPERWWPEIAESETALAGRCRRFRAAMAASPDWPDVAVVSHWGFIRGLTGRALGNGEHLRFDPTGG